MHRRYLIIILAYGIFCAGVFAGEKQRFWIFFHDPGNENKRESGIELREYAGGSALDSYIISVSEITDSITVRSRWLNAVSVPATDQQLERIQSLPFVKSVIPVARMQRPRPVAREHQEDHTLQMEPSGAENFYGRSAAQILYHGIDELHNMGITGRGVKIGFLDTAYKWDRHQALKNADVSAERDFVAEHYPGIPLPVSHYNHGTWVFSVVSGFDPGTYIGVAHDATFILGATEDVRTETPIEEDFWVAGIEWMGELGADIVSTSLGYSTFDRPYVSYLPEDMDGRTAVSTIAAEEAFNRGILVVASAGNEGNNRRWGIITAPADGENVVAVGAVTETGAIAPFSSRGPSADGRIKPDLSALGVGVHAALADTDGYNVFQGTSLSAPIVSGSAALVLSARPEMTAAELRNALIMTARRTGMPDNVFGYGILDAPAFLSYPVYRRNEEGIAYISAFLSSPAGLVEETIHLYVNTTPGGGYTRIPYSRTSLLEGSTSGLYEFEIRHDGALRFVITVRDSAGVLRRYPEGERREYYMSPENRLVVISEREIPPVFTLHQNYPNPFNEGTVIRFDITEDTPVSISVFDILGRYVATLTDDFYLAGIYEVIWRPSLQSSGVYFYRINYGGNKTAVGRMIFLR